MAMTWHFFSKLIFSSRAGALIRRISWLSVINVSISVAAFLIVLFVMNGMNLSLQDRIVALQPHLVITIPDISDPNLLDIHPVALKLREDKEKKVFVFENYDVVLRTVDGQFHGALAQGISPQSLKHILDEVHRFQKHN